LQVHIFRISGTYRSKRGFIEFRKEFRALREEDAIEHLYAELGSKHRIKRAAINVEQIEKLEALEDVKNPLILRLAMGTDITLTKE
jgi:large subunit ribosomal protein LX